MLIIFYLVFIGNNDISEHNLLNSMKLTIFIEKFSFLIELNQQHSSSQWNAIPTFTMYLHKYANLLKFRLVDELIYQESLNKFKYGNKNCCTIAKFIHACGMNACNFSAWS